MAELDQEYAVNIYTAGKKKRTKGLPKQLGFLDSITGTSPLAFGINVDKDLFIPILHLHWSRFDAL